MAKITEKLLTVEGIGPAWINLYPKYLDGECDAVLAELAIDGYMMGVGYELPMFENRKLTSLFMAMITTLEHNLAQELDKAVRGLARGDYGFDD